MSAENSKKTARKMPPGKPFEPGKSGNPGGRPVIPVEVVTAARAHTQAAIEKLADLMANGKDEKVQHLSAESLLNRAWGKPTDFVQISTPEGESINVTVAQAIDFAAIRAKAGK